MGVVLRARSAQALRVLADHPRAVRLLGRARGLGEAAGPLPSPEAAGPLPSPRRRGKPGAVDRLRRLRGQPGLPARGQRLQEGAADGDEWQGPNRSQVRQALGRSWGRVDSQDPPRRRRPGPPSPSCSRPSTSTTPPPSARSSTASASRALLRADLAQHRRGCWATRHIPAGRSRPGSTSSPIATGLEFFWWL